MELLNGAEKTSTPHNLQISISLTGRVAVVTGGRRGIGRAEALALALAGATVVVVTHSAPEDAERVVAEIKAAGGQASVAEADVTKSSEVQALVETTLSRYGRYDILVNNAGMVTTSSMRGKIVELSESIWDEILEAHLKGTFLCIKYSAPAMMEQGWGRIINTSSIHGRTGGRPGLSHYGAAKAGVEAMTKNAARELGPYGITVNAIAPGVIGTELVLTNPKLTGIYKQQNPLGRLGTPEEIANITLFLASEGASYVNGAVIECAGGRNDYYWGDEK